MNAQAIEHDNLREIRRLNQRGGRQLSIVDLIQAGEAEIVATNVNVVTVTKITCTFDLAGKATGKWNVVVTNPADTTPGTLTNGFTINAP